MRLRRIPPILLAAWLLWPALGGGSTPAEIRKKVGGSGEIVVTNRPPSVRHPGRPASKPSGGREVPATAPSPRIGSLLVATSTKYGFDPALIRAVVLAESAFDPMAVSRKGARGLMQLMPATAQELGVRNVHDPEANLEAGVAYLRQLALRHDGRMDLALAAYNAGPDAVARYGGVPPYEETREYLSRIRRHFGQDLNKGDWSNRQGTIRVTSVDTGGVLHFTNIKRRRIITPPEDTQQKPPAGMAGGEGER